MSDKTEEQWLADLAESYQVFMDYLARKDDLSEADKVNINQTPKRVAKAFMEMSMSRTDILDDLKQITNVGFPTSEASNVSGMLTQGPIHATSLCPHHIMPVEYEIFVSYLPNQNVLGLSKLARIAKLLAKRPVLQEELTSDIADVLFKSSSVPGTPSHQLERLHKTLGTYDEAKHKSVHAGNSLQSVAIQSLGSAVLVVGKHACMSCRGVESTAVTTTAEVRGNYKQQEMEQKFFQYVETCRRFGATS